MPTVSGRRDTGLGTTYCAFGVLDELAATASALPTAKERCLALLASSPASEGALQAPRSPFLPPRPSLRGGPPMPASPAYFSSLPWWLFFCGATC